MAACAYDGFHQAGQVSENSQESPVRPSQLSPVIDSDEIEGAGGSSASAAPIPEEYVCRGCRDEEVLQTRESAADGRLKVKRSPANPTKAQVEEHECTHIDFQPWCRHCVRGRGVSSPHKDSSSRAEDEVPLVSFDYAFPAGSTREA